MRGNCLRDTVEFDQNGTQVEAVVIHLGRVPSRKEARAGRLERGSGELRIRSGSRGVMNGAIRGNPIRFNGWTIYGGEG